MAFSAAFFVLSSFVPLYQYTEGYQLNEQLGIMDFTEQDTENTLADMMTEDGFLLKPAINSTAGDRSTANEIFAYEVESGDTLSSIAQKFGIKKETLIMENDLWSERVKIGMTLKVLPVDGISHLVKDKETIEKIAKKYSADKELLMKQNQLEDGSTLIAGTALIIPGAESRDWYFTCM